MRITTRATVLALALFATAPVLAANPGTSVAGKDAMKRETRMAEAQDDCWQPTLASTNLSAGQAGHLPTPDSTTPETSGVARHLHEAASCVRPLGLWNGSASPGWAHSDGAMPPVAGAAWLGQGSILEGSRGTDGLSAIQAR